MIKPEIAMDRNVEGKDDLKKIKGIGKSIAGALNQLGIHTYADLAACTPDQLSEMLRDRVPSIALQRARPEAWIRQARALEEAERAEKSRTNSADSPVVKAEQAEAQKRPAPARQGWREIADFFVSFGYEVDEIGEEHLRVRAHHSQADQLMQWDGIASNELLLWLLEQAKLSLETRSPEPYLETREDATFQPEKEEAIHLGLSNLWVSEVKVPVPDVDREGTAHLRVQGNLTLSGPTGEACTRDRLEYAIDILLVDTKTNRSSLAATYPGSLIPGNLSYQIQQDFPVPSIGRYQLYLIARIPPAAPITFMQGPIIVVEP